MERGEERPLEGRDRRARPKQPGGVERPRLRHERGAGRQERPGKATEGGGGPPVVKPEGNVEFVVEARNRSDGQVRWRKVVKELLPHEGTHKDGSYASGSALTDGERLYAFFGSRGLYALDFEGKVLWEKQLGLMQTRMGFGEGSSPALFGDTLVVNWDHEGQDFIVALDKKSG
jgi:outer membrane protein assembly factor BamB